MWTWFGIALAVALLIYAVFIVVLLLLGRRTDAKAWVRFVPDCVVLFTRLARDPRVSRRHKWLLVGLVAYLSMPIDLIPDFIPVAVRWTMRSWLHSSFAPCSGARGANWCRNTGPVRSLRLT